MKACFVVFLCPCRRSSYLLILDLGFLGIFALLLIIFNRFLAAIPVHVAFYLVWHVLYVH